MSSIDRSEALFRHEDLPLPVEIGAFAGPGGCGFDSTRSAGVLKLTGPLRMNRKAALDWAAEQREWVAAQLGAMLPPEPFVPARSFRWKAATCGWSGTRLRDATEARRRSAAAGDPRWLRPQDRSLPEATSARHLVGETAEIARRAGVTLRAVGGRRCRHALGKLLVVRQDPVQLAADPRTAGRPPLRRRA